jgi:hypothetical protein
LINYIIEMYVDKNMCFYLHWAWFCSSFLTSTGGALKTGVTTGQCATKKPELRTGISFSLSTVCVNSGLLVLPGQSPQKVLQGNIPPFELVVWMAQLNPSGTRLAR